MPKVIVTLFSMFLFIIPASARDFFLFEASTWSVRGLTGDLKTNPACQAELKYQDGSFVLVVQDLRDHEVYVLIKNAKWNIGGEKGTKFTLGLSFFKSDGKESFSGPANGILLFPAIIVIPQLDPYMFYNAFDGNSVMKITMPGTVSDIFIPLTGSSVALEKLRECMSNSEKVLDLNGAQ